MLVQPLPPCACHPLEIQDHAPPCAHPAQGADTLLGLLLLAREHAVEPAIAACLQQLVMQVHGAECDLWMWWSALACKYSSA